jgi:hypothetical protein
VGRWDQNGSWVDWLGGCGLDSTGSGQGPVAGCCECGDEPSGSCATELVKRDEVTGSWRKQHNEKLHNLYSSPNIKIINQGG